MHQRGARGSRPCAPERPWGPLGRSRSIPVHAPHFWARPSQISDVQDFLEHAQARQIQDLGYSAKFNDFASTKLLRGRDTGRLRSSRAVVGSGPRSRGPIQAAPRASVMFKKSAEILEHRACGRIHAACAPAGPIRCPPGHSNHWKREDIIKKCFQCHGHQPQPISRYEAARAQSIWIPRILNTGVDRVNRVNSDSRLALVGLIGMSPERVPSSPIGRVVNST